MYVATQALITLWLIQICNNRYILESRYGSETSKEEKLLDLETVCNFKKQWFLMPINTWYLWTLGYLRFVILNLFQNEVETSNFNDHCEKHVRYTCGILLTQIFMQRKY